MNKKQLIEKISQETGIVPMDVNAVLCSAINQIMTQLSAGSSVAIRNFATFTTKIKKAKAGYDFSCGKKINIDERRVPVVRFAKDFKNWIDETR